MEIEVELTCKGCGDILDVNNSYAVEPCKACIEESHEEGHKEGYEEGHKEGYEEGHKEGYEEGHKEGYEEGHKEGLKEGEKHE